MSDFEIDPTEIQQLQLPIELKCLSIGHIEIDIPYTHLGSKAVQVELSDVNLLIGPPKNTEWDAYSLYLAEQSKIYLLEHLMSTFSPKGLQAHTPNGQDEAGEPSGVVLSILKNLQVQINRVHLRYEDSVSGSDAERPCKFAFGLTLEKFSIDAGNTEAEWHEKRAEIENLGVYFKDDIMYEHHSDIKEKFRKVFDDPAWSSYLIKPMSAKVDLKLNLPTALNIHVMLNPINVRLSMEHYRYMICLLDGIDKYDRFLLYRRFRPAERPNKTNGKSWWKYAMTCILMDLNDPFNGKTTWKKTLNLMLVGLHYTAVRRMIKPHLIRDTFKSPSGEEYLHYRENFTGVHDQKDPIRGLHYFGQSDFQFLTKVYGLIPATQAAEPNQAAMKQLWLRQLCIEASFRPYIIAKLRLIADTHRVIHHRKKLHALHPHNAIPGVFSITLGSAVGLKANVKPFFKLRIGQDGKAHKGPIGLVESGPKHLLCQTFVFHLKGTDDEDFLYLELYDKWPIHDHKLAEVKVDLVRLIKSDVHEDGLGFHQQLTPSSMIQVATLFNTTGDTTRTSKMILQEHFPESFEETQHQFLSWYGTEEGLKTSFQLDIPFLQVDLSLQETRTKLSAMVGPIAVKDTETRIASLEIVHAEEPVDSVLRQLLKAPREKGKTFIISTETYSYTSDIDVQLSLPHLSRHVQHVVNSVPELQKLFQVMESPFYRGLMQQWKDSTQFNLFKSLSNAKKMDLKIEGDPIYISIPDQNGKSPALFEFILPPADLKILLTKDKFQLDNLGNKMITIPLPMRQFMMKARSMYHLLETQWKQASETTPRRDILRLCHTFDQMSAQIGGLRRQILQLNAKSPDPMLSERAPKEMPPLSLDFLFQQGISVLKHNRRSGEPNWKVFWIENNTIHLSRDRNKATTRFKSTDIQKITTGISSTALERTGLKQHQDKYLTIHLSSDEIISLEFQSNQMRQLTMQQIMN